MIIKFKSDEHKDQFLAMDPTNKKLMDVINFDGTFDVDYIDTCDDGKTWWNIDIGLDACWDPSTIYFYICVETESQFFDIVEK
ncbi:hypothetical protein 65p231 [Aeromonas phage 65]|uniref:Uncharacterized protein n=2 Tax=Ishigurovirus osborne TaxID=260149 RepID=A0A219YC71_9CAUD|nr:goF mRNA metabolism modulator [Aeromonas phage 65]ADQ53239.1 hypothetical protein 65p231 [Aeromonas phage 65]APU01614.1 hypothetical protein [Aeromonas phage 65.2]